VFDDLIVDGIIDLRGGLLCKSLPGDHAGRKEIGMKLPEILLILPAFCKLGSTWPGGLVEELVVSTRWPLHTNHDQLIV
jgi:hypothetical protein